MKIKNQITTRFEEGDGGNNLVQIKVYKIVKKVANDEIIRKYPNDFSFMFYKKILICVYECDSDLLHCMDSSICNFSGIT